MKTCLVVDDSTVIRRVCCRIMSDLEFETLEAEDGEKALAACLVKMPDAILLDWNMPKMDGYEFLKSLRRTPGGMEPKVIFVASDNDVSIIARALHAGANEYVMKPFDREIIREKLVNVGLMDF